MVVLMLVMTLMEVLALLVLRSKPRRFEVLQCLLSVKTVAAEKLKIHCEKYPPPPPPQPTLTCSKPTMESPEQCVKFVQS